MATNFPDTSIDNPFVTPPRPWINGDEFDDTTKSGLIYYWNDPVWKTKAGDLTVPSLNGGPLAGFRNQIINGDFSIWQRGTAGGTNTAPEYVSADRWKLENSSAGTSLNARSAAPVGFIGSTSLINGATIQQKIEAWTNFVSGDTWTASFIADAPGLTVRIVNDDGGFDSGQLTVTQGESVPPREGSDTWHKYYVSYPLPANATGAVFPYVALEITNSSTQRIALVGVQFEPGPVATPFEHRPVATELALCQRYFIAYDFGSTQDSVKAFYARTNASSSACPYHIDAKMRSQPTVDFANITCRYVNGSGNPSSPLTPLSFITDKAVYLGAQGLSTSTVVGIEYTGVLTINAEL